MDKEDIFVVLQACVFAFNISEEEVINLGYNPQLVKIGFQMKRWLSKLKIENENFGGEYIDGR